MVESLKYGTSRRSVQAERSDRRPGMSATRVSGARYRGAVEQVGWCDRWTRTSPSNLTRWSDSISTTDTGTTGPSWRWRRYTTRSTFRAWTRLQAVSPSTRDCWDTSTSSRSASPDRTLYTRSTVTFCHSTWSWRRFQSWVLARCSPPTAAIA